MIYLDYNATTPVDPNVAGAMRPFLFHSIDTGGFGNPSSSHVLGRDARTAVEEARGHVADRVGADPPSILFTSGGSESNNTVLKGVARRPSSSSGHLVTTRIEHPSVLEPCRVLEERGWTVTYLPVDSTGRVDPEDLRGALREDTVLVSVMHANNEVGTIQPLEPIGEILSEHDALLHTDAAQSVGKIPVDVGDLGVDFLTVAGHKLHAPKGIGALYVRDPELLDPLIHGAGQESGRRAGTEPVPMNVALGEACRLADPREYESLRDLRDQFFRELKSTFGDRVVLNGHPDRRLPNTLNVSFVGREGPEILRRAPSLAASTGSACHEGSVELSPVLAAMGLEDEVGMGALRFSLGRFTREEDVRRAVRILETSLLP